MDSSLISLILPLVLLGTNSSALYYERVYPPVSATDNSSNHVYIGFMVSFGGLLNSSANVPGVRVAVDLINNDTCVLKDYTLHYVLSDSQCNRQVASKAALEQMLNEPTKLALIGAGCSLATEPVAELTSLFNISQLSCSSASHELGDRTKFPYYFQLLPTSAGTAPAYNVISKEFNWNHIAFIVQNENLFTVSLQSTLKLLDQRNVSYSVNMFETALGISSVQRPLFENPDERIFVINSYQQHAEDIVCEAFRRGIGYPTHVLITYWWYVPGWWLDEWKSANCSVEERETVLNNSLAVNFIVVDLINEINSTTMGISGMEYLEKEAELRANFGNRFSSQYCFDATWTFAYALNRTLNDIAENTTFAWEIATEYGIPFNQTFKLTDFNYNSSLLISRLFEHMSDSAKTFDGVTGNVAFDENGIRITNLLSLHQFRHPNRSKSNHLELIEVARFPFKESTGTFVVEYTNSENISSIWPDGVPKDGVVRRQMATVFVYVTIIFSVFTTIGIVFTFICLAFNFLLRQRKLIRMTSPNLNYLIIFGSLLYYVDVYFYVLPIGSAELQHTKCTVTTWLTALGYSFSFGPIVAKMFRVWFIFWKPSLKKKVIHDWKLAVGVLVLVALDLAILTVYNSIISTGEDAVLVTPSKELQPTKVGDVPVMYVSYVCGSVVRDVIIGVFFGYKVVVQVAALVLTFLTRKVKVKGLDDSKYIAAIIYINSITLAAVFICSYTLKEHINVFAAVLSTGILVSATSVLALVFIPKMIGLYKDPNGKNVFVTNTATSFPETVNTVTDNRQNENEILKSRIKELEDKLSQQSPKENEVAKVAAE